MKVEMAPDRTAVPLVPAGATWVTWTPARAEMEPLLRDAVTRFEAIDQPAGVAAAKFLQEDALANDPSTRTHLLMLDDVVEGYISLSNAVVRLERADADDLAVIHRRDLPATLLAWVARRRDSIIPGLHLVDTAHALAREAAKTVGSVAFVLDAADEATRQLWLDYGFRPSRRRDRLWIPLEPGS